MRSVEVFTDGGCRGNKEKENIGAWAYTMSYEEAIKEDYGVEKDTTNNRQEMVAVIKALRAIKTTHIPINIHTDSAYVIGGATDWIHGWKRNGWRNSKGRAVVNKDLWLILDELILKQDRVELLKVKGHSDSEGNNRADLLVNIAMDKYMKEVLD